MTAANRAGCPFTAGRFETSPAELDISRSDNSGHLSFGVTHVCMGAELAIENAKRMIEAVLRRTDGLESAGSAVETDGDLFTGLVSLPVRADSWRPLRVTEGH